MTNVSQTSNIIIFTESAALKVYQLIEEEGNPSLNLRVFITGGGCSGFQYGFTFDETISPEDTVVEKEVRPASATEEDDSSDGGSRSGTIVKLLVDPMSFQYLVGAEIDYREDIDGARFVIRNPNAQTTCGCGSSFSA